MTKEQIEQKAKTYSKNYWYNTNNSVNVASIEKLLIDFATEVTKELQEENERLKEIEEDYYDFLQKKNEEDWKGDNVVGCLNLRIEQKDKQLIRAKELLNMFLRLHYNPILDEHSLFCKVEQFLKEVEK